MLVGLANHAGPRWVGCVPVGGHLGPLHRPGRADREHLPGSAAGADVIRPCAPRIVAARIKRADHRPKGCDLNLSQVRDDLTDADLKMLEA